MHAVDDPLGEVGVEHALRDGTPVEDGSGDQIEHLGRVGSRGQFAALDSPSGDGVPGPGLAPMQLGVGRVAFGRVMRENIRPAAGPVDIACARPATRSIRSPRREPVAGPAGGAWTAKVRSP